MKTQIKIHIENSLHSSEEGKIIDLSQEVLSVSDYEWLAEIIKKSSFVEIILLPTIPNEDTEIILSILNKPVLRSSTLIRMDINISTVNEGIPDNVLLIIEKIQSHLQININRKFGIHGGGNMGLGFMADIANKGLLKYHILATSNNQFLCDLINSTNKLWLQHNLSDPCQSTCVNNITMISRESQDVIRLYTESCLVALCVTPAVMPDIAKDIAHALIMRYKMDGGGLKILVLMNIPNCAKFVRDKIVEEMLLITGNESYTEEILSSIEFVPTVIDRIVIPVPVEKIKLQLKLQLKTISKSALLFHINEDNIETILASSDKLTKAVSIFNLQFNLFNSERNLSMYVRDDFVEAYQFPLIKMTKDLDILETVKIKYINDPHAILAWTGALLGFTTIAESIEHPALFSLIKKMMENEIGPILNAVYPEISHEDLALLEASFFERCAASIDDPTTRVGRDPLRKMIRIIDTIALIKKYNLKIDTSILKLGLAAAILYALKEIDPHNPGCQKIREIYKNNNNSFSAVLCYSGPAPCGSFSGLNPYKDRGLIKSILRNIVSLDQLHEKRTATERFQSSTALVLSKADARNQSASVPKVLFTSSDHFASCSLTWI